MLEFQRQRGARIETWSNGSHRGSRRWYVAAIGLLSVLMADRTAAQGGIYRPFTVRAGTGLNIPGDFVLIGNTSMVCSTTRGGSTVTAGCATGRNGGGSLTNNDNVFMEYHRDASLDLPNIFNSSSATFTLPETGAVIWAGLYWAGQYNGGSEVNQAGTANDIPAGNAAPNPQSRFRIFLRTPTSGSLLQIDAQVRDEPVNAEFPDLFHGFTDVTDIVTAGGSGTYTVANIQSGTGRQRTAGWTLVVLVGDPTQPVRNLTVFDGSARIYGNVAVNIPVSGFLTPAVGEVRTRIGVSAYEGDLGITGDQFLLNGQALTEPAARASNNNFFNSAISRLGTNITSRSPSFTNAYGYDISYLDATGRVANGATSATITLRTSNDLYVPMVVAFATELFAVSLAPTVFKTAVDINGGELLPGDTVRYNIAISNATGDGAVDLRLIDTIPAGTRYAAGSLQINAGMSPVGPRTDAAGDDIAEFDATGNRVVFRLGSGANATSGGLIRPGESVLLRYQVVVNDETPLGTTITNQARVVYNGETQGEAHNDPTDGSPSPGIQPTTIRVSEGTDLAITKTTDVPAVSVGSIVTFGIRVTNAGAFAAQNVVITDTIPPGMEFVSTSSGATPNANGVVTFTAQTLPPGAVQVFTVRMRATAVGTFRNASSVTSSTRELNPANNHAEASVLAQEAGADIQLTKSGPTTANPDEDIVYTIEVFNKGPVVARDLVITDTLDVSALFLAASRGGRVVRSPGAPTPSQQVVWEIASLEVDQSVTFHYTVRTPARGGTLVDVASSVSSTSDPVPSNNDGTAPYHRVTTLVQPPSDLVVTKEGTRQAAPGGAVEYTITVRNAGLSAARDVVVTDTLPANATFVSASAGGTVSAGVVTWPTIPELAVNTDTVFTVRITAPADAGTLLDIAAAASASTDANPSDNRSTWETIIVAPLNVSITKIGPTSAAVGDEMTYTLTATNAGPGAASNVAVSDTLPIGMTVVNAGGGVVSGSAASGFVVTWPEIATLAAAATRTLTLVVQAASAGAFVNVARVTTTSPETDVGDNRSTITTTVAAPIDVAITKRISGGSATEGAEITYELTASKASEVLAPGVVIADTLPAGVTFVSADNGGTHSAGVVTWPASDIAIGTATRSVHVTVRINPETTQLRNVATVTTTALETNLANNVFVLNTPVGVQGRDLAITKSAIDAVASGERFTYLLTATNGGTLAAAGVVVTDTLPANATFVAASDSPAQAGRVLTWTLGTLAAGASRTFTVTVDAPAAADTLVNIARIEGVDPDPDVSNNRDTTVTIVAASANLAIAKTGPATATAGSTVTYTITAANLGPSVAERVVITDTLPADATFVSASGGGTLAGRVVTWPTIATLATGASQDFTLVITAPPTSGAFTNVAAVTSSTPDPNPDNNRAAFTTGGTPIPTADVAVVKTGPATATVGETVIYRILIGNSGPAEAQSVIVTDTLPAGASFVSASDGGTLIGNVVTWPTIASLPSGVPRTFTVTLALPVVGTAINVAAATTTTTDSDPANNRDEASTAVGASADVSITKAGPATAAPGSTVTYTLTVTNNGPSPATAVVTTDTLPAGTTFVSATAGGTLSGNIVTWPAIASLAASESQTFTLVVTAPTASGAFTNIAAVTSATPDDNAGNNRASVTTTDAPPTMADISVTKRALVAARASASLSYQLTVANSGPATAENVVLTDTLPPGATFVSATRGGTVAGNVVTWPAIASLASGASEVYALVITPPATGGAVVNVAAVTTTTDDPNLANNRATFTTNVEGTADVAVTKSGPATVAAGGSVSYTLSVANLGPSTAANVTVTDTLPTGATFVSATGGGTLNGRVVSWPAIASLESGISQTFTVVVTAPTSPGSFTNIAAATSTTADENTSNNRVAVVTNVDAPNTADISVTKRTLLTARAHASLTYQLTVANAGPAAAANVVLTDTLPAGATFVSATGGGTLAGNVVTWPAIPSLESGQNVSYALVITPPSVAGAIVNIAAVTTTTTDPNLANNRATFTTDVDVSANLVVTKTGPPSAVVGDTVSYAITVRNAGPSPAADVAVSDTIPANSTFVSADNGGSISGRIVSWPTIATLANGATAAFTVRVVVSPSGASTIVNIAAVTSSTSDPDPGDNRTTVTTPLGPTPASADLATIKTGPATVVAGGTIEYTIMVVNQSAIEARDVRVTDTIPSGAVFVSASGGATVQGRVVTWPVIPALAGGASVELRLRVTFFGTGTFINVAGTTSSTSDPNPDNNTSRITTTSAASADLVVTKRNPLGISTGRSLYVIVVRNLGPSVAENVRVVDFLPEPLRFESGTGGAVAEGQRITFAPIPSLAVNDSVRFEIVVTTAPGVAAGTSVTNVAETGSSTNDPDPRTNRDSVTTVVSNVADVAIDKTGPLTGAVGDTLLWVISVRNRGPGVATGVRVSDRLPDGVRFVSANRDGVAEDGVVTWPAIDSLRAGELSVFTVEGIVTSAHGGIVIRNLAIVSTTSRDPIAGNDTASTGSAIVDAADVVAQKTGPATARSGEEISYAIRVFNRGPGTAFGVVVSDTLPIAAEFVAATQGGTLNGRVVHWPAILRLEVGDTVSHTVVVRLTGTGTAVNIVAADAISPDSDPTNNNGSRPDARVVTTLGRLDVALRMRAIEPFARGAVGRYVLTVDNVGDVTTTGPLTIVDTLPAGLTFVRGGRPISAALDNSANLHVASAAWSCSAEAQVVRCSNPDLLAPRDTTVFDIEALVGAAAPQVIVNRAIVSTPGDTVPVGNNIAEVTVTLAAVEVPLIVLDKMVSRAVAEIGDAVEYTLRVRNTSNSVVTGLVLVDTLPLGFQYLAGSARLDAARIADPAGAPGPRLEMPIGDLLPNASMFVRYRVRLGPAAPTGDGINRAQASNGITRSNVATAQVRVIGGVFSERGFIVGRVALAGTPEVGIPGVRVYLEDGSGAVTDGEGKFSFVGVSPRMHIVKVDRTTLPDSARLVATSSRNAGDGASRFVDLQRWELARADFLVADAPPVRAVVVARRAKEPSGVATFQRSEEVETLTGERRVASSVAVQRPDPASTGMPSDTMRLGGVTEPIFRPLAGDYQRPVGEASQLSATPFDSARSAPRLRLTVPADGVPADGQTGVRIGVHVDRAAFKNADSIAITLEATRGHWRAVDRDSVQPGIQTFINGDSAELVLVAPAREGAAVVRVTAGALSDRAEIAFVPATRPIVLAGVLGGRVDMRSLSRGTLVSVTPNDAFQDELQTIATTWDDGAARAGARAALFLRGKITGDALLTLSYDSDRESDPRTFADIRPEEFYPIYGDAAAREFDAQSYERLYVRVDKDRSFFLFGDFLTPAVSRARELGAYMRTFTGATGHAESKYGEVNVFGSRERISNIVNELPGLGTSGPYVLSSRDVRLNTERVEIITRDRTQPSRVLRIVPQERFVDYVLEPFTGRLYFRRPIPSLDEYLNPVTVRVTYVVDRAFERYWQYGINGAIRPLSFLEVGGNAVRDEDPLNSRQLFSTNATLKVGASTALVGEWAQTDTDSLGRANAARFELRHRSKYVDALVFGIVTDSGFNNPSSTAIRGRSELGLRSAVNLTASTRLLADWVRSENRVNDGRLDGGQVSVEQTLGARWRFELGGRWSKWTDSAYNVSMRGVPSGQLNAARGRVTATMPGAKPGSLFAEYEQDVSESDARRASVGGDYWLDRRLKLYGRTEFLNSLDAPYTLNDAQGRSNTVIGLDAQWLRTGQVYSEYRLNDVMSGRDGQAVIGLRNRWHVATGVAVDATFERVNITEGERSLTREGTAVTGALEYTRPQNWRGTARLEYRDGQVTNDFLASLGYALRLNRELALLGRGLWSELGDRDRRGRAQIGLAWREVDQGKWNALARVEQQYEKLGTAAAGLFDERRATILSTHLNWQPIRALTFTPTLAIKASHDATPELDEDVTTYLTQLRTIYDLTRSWDVGATGSVLGAGSGLGRRFGLGGEVGRRVVDNLRAAIGYNVIGFRDGHALESNYTLRGPYFRFDYKFDEAILSMLRQQR